MEPLESIEAEALKLSQRDRAKLAKSLLLSLDDWDRSEAEMPLVLTTEIHTFAPEPHRVKQPIPITIEQQGDDEFVASFLEANVNASGETEAEAFSNVRSLILDVYDHLVSQPAEQLGRGPRGKLAVLREFIDGP